MYMLTSRCEPHGPIHLRIGRSQMLEFPVEPQSPTGCPFDPPSAYRDLLERPGLAQAQIWNDSRAWLVARYDEFREVCGNPGTFSSADHPNYPYASAGAKP